MKKIIAVAAVIGLGISLTWAAEQIGALLGFAQQEPPASESAPGSESTALTSTAVTRNALAAAPPSTQAERLGSRLLQANEGDPPSADPQAEGEADTSTPPELSEEVASIEEDLARIEEALESEEVLEEFTPSEPLSADNPVPWPTDI